jgi:2-polyprenyl-3-methyl-5-hydroxy-6-metoxy-1,4-benzoquinol methylase
MFTREDNSYEYDDDLVKNILRDEASPMTRIFNIIPEGSKVLDVGAGNGILAKLFIHQEKNILIDGIEPNEHASNIAKTGYRKF